MPDPPDTPTPRNGPWKPVPDPTELTTEALRREIFTLSEQFGLRLTGVANTISARLDAMDRAQTLFEANLNRLPSNTDRSIAQLEALHNERFRSFEQRLTEFGGLEGEKFRSIEIQFKERDTRVEQTAHDTKVAVDAALLAQQAASDKQAESFAASIMKSETAFGKQLEAMGQLISSSKAAADDKFEDLKERLARLESTAVGAMTQSTEHRQVAGGNVAIIMAVIAAIALLVSVAAAIFVATRH